MPSVDFVDEIPVYFPCDGLMLAGILGVPAEPNGLTVLIPWGSGAGPSSGRNRLRARLARQLTAEGCHSFRFDYQGVAESEGQYRPPDLSSPNTGEIVAASTWLRSLGLNRIALVANCFGAWSSLLAAAKIEGIEAMALVNSPVFRDHDQVRGSRSSWRWWVKHMRRFRWSNLRSPTQRALYAKLIKARSASLVRASPPDSRFSRSVQYLLDNRIPLLLLYGTDPFRTDLESELDGGLRVALQTADPPTRLVTVPHKLAGWANLEVQDLLISEVIPWLHEVNFLRAQRS